MQIAVGEPGMVFGLVEGAYEAGLRPWSLPPDQLVNPQRPKHFKGLNSSDMARMEQEMSMVQSRFKAIELSYGNDVLNLVLARGYVSKILNNTAVTAYLQRNQPEFLDEFRAIVAATALDDSPVLATKK